jgi:hypothetical protein
MYAMASVEDKQVPEVPEVMVVPVRKKNPQAEWEDAVRQASHDKCGNCGNDDRLAIKMIVPLEAGGMLEVSNGYVICRACEIAKTAADSGPTNREAKRPINFWISRKLSEHLQKVTHSGGNFGSMGSLVRYMMSMYVIDESRFEDLEQFQDADEDRVKLNVWVEPDRYNTFKALVDKRGLTVTDALRSLLRLFELEADRLSSAKEIQ